MQERVAMSDPVAIMVRSCAADEDKVTDHAGMKGRVTM